MTVHRLLSRTVAALVVSASVGLAPATGSVSPSPDLLLSPDSGHIGSTAEATATGFYDCAITDVEPGVPDTPGTVTFRWAGIDWAGTTEVDLESGEADAVVAVPDTPGDHILVATCDVEEGLDAEGLFTVLPPPDTPESLDLVPTTGQVDDSFAATVTGFECSDEIGFYWDGEERIDGVVTDGATTTVSGLVVPESGEGDHVVSASCESDASQYAEAVFTVTQEPDVPERLRLDPDSGQPGDPFDATASGYECDTDVVFLWDGEDLLGRSPVEDGTAVAENLEVPAADPGSYPVIAQCADDDSQRGEAPFEVGQDPVASPELELLPRRGPAGSLFSATATGFRCSDDIHFFWRGAGVTARAAIEPDGAAAAMVRVPRDFAVRSVHVLVAACASDDSEQTQARFTVTARPATTETLALSPDAGGPDSRFTALASGYQCLEVVFLWDGEERTREPTDEHAAATAALQVPDDADPGTHVVSAVCAQDTDQDASAEFAVDRVDPVVNLTSYWPAAAVLLVLLAGGLPGLRVGRDRWWRNHHLRVRPVPAAGRTWAHSPEDPSTFDVDVRIQPHGNPVFRTIEEVDP